MVGSEPKDDRVLLATRWASAVVVAVLLPALVILWGLPGRTHTLWAWTIKPEMTPIFMGSAYGAGAVAFYGWTGLYIASPFVVAYLWLRNQRTDSGTREPGDPQVPQWVRLTARAASVAAIAAGLCSCSRPRLPTTSGRGS